MEVPAPAPAPAKAPAKAPASAPAKAPAIMYKANVLRSNERCVVFDIWDAMSTGDTVSALSAIKTWLAMNDKTTKPTDEETVRMYEAMSKVVFVGKYASVKERSDGKKARLDMCSQGRLKAWLYTFRRDKYMIEVVRKASDRPEEKQGKARHASAKIDPAELEAFRAWKALQEQKAI